MSYKNFFFFDIETTSKFKDLQDLKDNDVDGFNLFKNKYEAMKKNDPDWDVPIEQAYISKAPLLPEYGKIICLSFGVFDTKNSEQKLHIMTLMDEDESNLMKRISHVFLRAKETGKTLCGFKIKEFDLPWIVKKMYKHGIDLPSNLNFVNMKPWEMNITDISDVWRVNGRNSSSLDEVSYDLGLFDTKDRINGKEIYNHYWESNDKESITKHCENSVSVVIKIAEKIKL